MKTKRAHRPFPNLILLAAAACLSWLGARPPCPTPTEPVEPVLPPSTAEATASATPSPADTATPMTTPMATPTETSLPRWCCPRRPRRSPSSLFWTGDPTYPAGFGAGIGLAVDLRYRDMGAPTDRPQRPARRRSPRRPLLHHGSSEGRGLAPDYRVDNGFRTYLRLAVSTRSPPLSG